MFKTALSDEQLRDLAQHLQIPLRGIHMRNTPPTHVRPGAYIWNMDDAGSQGTHWTATYCTPRNAFYFDSFGAPPPLELDALLRKQYGQYKFNNWIIQDPATPTCGLFCLAFLHFMHTVAAPWPLKAEAFAQLFADNTKDNERLLRTLNWSSGNLFPRHN